MECEETRVDTRNFDKEEMELGVRNSQLIFRINHTMPFTEEYDSLVKELFGDRIGESTRLTAPFNLVSSEHLRIGKNVYIGGNLLGMQGRHRDRGRCNDRSERLADIEQPRPLRQGGTSLQTREGM